jgi:site-specific DNA-methyltransferase (adenine-specific)
MKRAPAVPREVPPPVIDGFAVEVWPLERILPYPGNPRRNEAAIGKVAASLREFGVQQPIVVDEAGVIIAGHTRLLASKLLQLATFPVHVARGLAPAQVKAYRLADNRLAEEADWDDSLLMAELRALQEAGVPLAVTGFEDAELEALFGGNSLGVQPHADPEEIPPVPKTPKSKLGELYQLGPHRLLCGDATLGASWARLMQGETADLIWTDPPYDVAYQGGTQAKLTIQNDNLGHEGTVRLLRSLLSNALIHLKAGGAVYVCAPHGPQFYAFAKVGTELGFWRQTILWIKDSFAFGRSDYHYRHEAILTTEGPLTTAEVETIGYGWKPGAAHTFYGGRKQDTGWEVPRPRANEDHPTPKPVELVTRALVSSSVANELCVDCCAGGGSLLIAAHLQGRRARCMELDPRYVDVILARWQAVTGIAPVLLGSTTSEGAP